MHAVERELDHYQRLLPPASSIPGSGSTKRCLSFVRLKYDLTAGHQRGGLQLESNQSSL